MKNNFLHFRSLIRIHLTFSKKCGIIFMVIWGCGEMADAKDLKSFGSDTMRVRLPPAPPNVTVI